MSKRMEMIERLAETDDYWKGYLDGLNRTREVDDAEWREYARLTAAREARRGNWDDDWSPTPAA